MLLVLKAHHNIVPITNPFQQVASSWNFSDQRKGLFEMPTIMSSLNDRGHHRR